ncbi:MAG TPA: DUF1501 domain-containing protein [Planctomycetota bacterium]|nr:DUF1501 domain-containing protein [Planctomycetota bacterium]
MRASFDLPESEASPSPPALALLDRRRFLRRAVSGLGGIALASLLTRDGLLGGETRERWAPRIDPTRPSAPRVPPRSAPARRVLVLFASGALSHVDTWDYKPALEAFDGQPMPGADKLITFQGEQGNLARSPWTFRPRGASGKWVSDLLPRLGAFVDEMCFIHSMTAKSNTHGPAENQMSTGFILDGFPSMGAWCSYALGTENEDLPAFVAIPDPRGVPQSGPNNWASGFLPAVFQGVPFTADRPIPHLERPKGISRDEDIATRDLLRFLNERHLEANPGDTTLSARIASYELAARMQLRASEVADLSDEPAWLLERYGATSSNRLEAAFARNCILARRLLERGVRFVQVFNGAYAMGEGVGNWDGHRVLREQYETHAKIFDRPAAALLADLRERGLLEDTLVVGTTEFGRMPTFQKGTQGRDHNPSGFTAWLAGAGVRHGFSYGATDEFGHRAVERIVTIPDFHATILWLLGIDHERLTVYHDGTERRLTDVHGRILRDILA